MRKALTVVVAGLLAGLFALGGCGPVEYVSQVTRKASSEVAAARSVDAEKWAPYHYTRAVEYLEKAHEEASRADYQAANRFGRKSHESAVKAKELSIERSARGELPGPPPLEVEDEAKATPKRDDSKGPIEDAPEAGSE